MSAKLGTLTLDLVTRTAGFTAPIKDAEKQTKVSFDAMKKSALLYGAVAVSGAAAVGAGVFAMAREYSNAARELQIFASISNTTTQEFQRMAVGAETMGINQEKLSDQLKDFNEKLGEFITIGSGGAVDFFEQIAIKTEGSAEGARKLALEMQNLSGPKALQLYVDKLEEAGVTQQQMSFYLESMASDTTNLIPLLREGGKGFEYWADAAERAGVIMDEQAIAKANELRVQMDLLNLQVQGVKNQFIQGLMPALVSVGDGLSDATMETNLMADAGETLGEVFKGVAATGMGVYAVVKMLSNAIAGLAFDAVNAKKMVDASAEKGSWADKLPGVKFAKTAILGTAMIKSSNGGVAMAAKDNAKVADDVANSINRIYSNAVNQSVSAMAKIQNSQAGVAKGSDDWVKKQNDAAKAASKASKANSEAAKALREYNQAFELGKRLIYEFGDEQLRISEDLNEDLKDIQSALLKPEAKERYAALARMQADARKKAYIAELDFELNEHKSTEERKLADELRINKLKLDAQRGLNKNEIDLRKQALDERYQQELTMLRISEQKQLLETKRHWMTAGDYARDYYALIREEILNTASYSPDMKEALLQQASSQQNLEESYERDSAIEDYRDVMGYEENPLERQFEVLQKMRELDLLNEEAYQNAKLELQAKSTASYMEGMLGGFASLVDENSKTYAVLFGAQKAFAVAQAMLNIPAAYSKAYDAVVGTPFVGPYIAPAVGAAAAALQVAQAASMKSVNLTGMAHDGIDNIPQEGTWLLDGGERVLNPEQNKDLTRYLSEARESNSSPNVNLNPNFVIVDERQNLSDYLFSPDGTKAFVKFFRRNRTALGV
ncbi:phage tail tape measure protein [Acinetobacter pecorum]|uniref:Phage tail tape measure protein n=1 Tax=Acinetobacter pecorum TaxID=2762215 RepID=A0ABR8VU68_9GAMM|nr:phage tail tape measure protein [Acinetobacter pecorum]MBD8008313.1 phage tail tape measure protein [Acinetobacter pecorum]